MTSKIPLRSPVSVLEAEAETSPTSAGQRSGLVYTRVPSLLMDTQPLKSPGLGARSLTGPWANPFPSLGLGKM